MKSIPEPRHWIGVVSRQHVLRGVAGGFAQIGHGKAAPLRRMAVGDRLIYYSPVDVLGEAAPCRRFAADKRRWGFPFRRGFLAIGAGDFARIAAAMGIDPA